MIQRRVRLQLGQTFANGFWQFQWLSGEIFSIFIR
jgi:hypothetical protein